MRYTTRGRTSWLVSLFIRFDCLRSPAPLVRDTNSIRHSCEASKCSEFDWHKRWYLQVPDMLVHYSFLNFRFADGEHNLQSFVPASCISSTSNISGARKRLWRACATVYRQRSSQKCGCAVQCKSAYHPTWDGTDLFHRLPWSVIITDFLSGIPVNSREFDKSCIALQHGPGWCVYHTRSVFTGVYACCWGKAGQPFSTSAVQSFIVAIGRSTNSSEGCFLGWSGNSRKAGMPVV